MVDDTRATLLERLRDGADQLSWEDFFHRYWSLIYASARHRGCSEHTADEVVQDVMLAVFDNRDVYQYDPGRGRFRDWLSVVVRNKVAERRRRPSERIRAPGGLSDAAPVDAETSEPPPGDAWQDAFENALLGVLLDTARREMDPRTYLAFELSALAELPVAQVAAVTGLSRNAVYKARRRVLKRLAELGADYRTEGRLNDRLKEAMKLRPSPPAERALTSHVERTMISR